MRSRIVVLLLLAPALGAAQTVIDRFDDGTNPNGWYWGNSTQNSIDPSGGDPDGWLDGASDFWTSNPILISRPADGTPLRDAIASGALISASASFQRLSTIRDPICSLTDGAPNEYSVVLIDNHTIGTGNGQWIYAWSSQGNARPGGNDFPWMTVTFDIPGAAREVPPGWNFSVPPDIDYGWRDLMNNIDMIGFWLKDPTEITFQTCWHLGADNVVVRYGDAEVLFEDGFDR
jgi:hypothetical protein